MDPLNLQIVGYTAGFLTTVCLIPQLWKIIVTKSARDVSVLTYLVLLCGQILWIVYGIFISDIRVVIPNVISGFFGLLVIISSLYYNK